MLLKKENGQLIIPASILAKYGEVEYFDVVAWADSMDITPEPEGPKERKGVASLQGMLKGKVWMSDDFNETPEEFAEYI